MPVDRVPLTVIGGYLGAGKTTLINRLLQQPAGRRIGVIVNDFGSIGIDVRLLAESPAGRASDVISLPNGCVCCTIGSGLQEALAQLVDHDPMPDHVVIEVSGVADPASAAAWATVPPFEPSGVIVLAAADAVQTLAGDRYVGDEVVRQLAGADLVVVTKSDLCAPSATAEVERWIDEVTGGVQRLTAVEGRVPTSILLGVAPGRAEHHDNHHDNHHDDHHHDPEHAVRYTTWAWSSDGAVPRAGLDAFLAEVPPGVLRLKGIVALSDGAPVVIQRVGRRSHVRPIDVAQHDAACTLTAVGLREELDPAALTRLAERFLR